MCIKMLGRRAARLSGIRSAHTRPREYRSKGVISRPATELMPSAGSIAKEARRPLVAVMRELVQCRIAVAQDPFNAVGMELALVDQLAAGVNR